MMEYKVTCELCHLKYLIKELDVKDISEKIG